MLRSLKKQLGILPGICISLEQMHAFACVVVDAYKGTRRLRTKTKSADRTQTVQGRCPSGQHDISTSCVMIMLAGAREIGRAETTPYILGPTSFATSYAQQALDGEL